MTPWRGLLLFSILTGTVLIHIALIEPGIQLGRCLLGGFLIGYGIEELVKDIKKV